MSELVERLRHIADDDMWAKGDEYSHTIATAIDRIEALEFEVEHERYNVEKTAQEAADRIATLEADRTTYNEWAAEIKIGVVCLNERIEALVAALQHASIHLADLEYHYHGDREAMWKPIRAALAPEQKK